MSSPPVNLYVADSAVKTEQVGHIIYVPTYVFDYSLL